MKKRLLFKQIIALSMCVCVIVISLLSMIFIISHLHHNCLGENCPICEQIKNAESFINQFSMSLGQPVIAAFICAIVYSSLLLIYFSIAHHSPVHLKVRLNN